MRNKKKNRYMLLLILLLGITLGYAAISTTLKINGSATVKKHTWDVYWGVPTVTTGSVTTTVPTRTQETGDPANTKLIWSTTLELPGDFYEFTVDAVNNGDVDAMITGITPTVSPALPTNPDYIKYTVTYADGVTPVVNHLLAKKTGNTPTTETYKVRVYYDETVATRDTINNMTSDTTYTFTLDITYGQATDEAIEKPSDAYFATDSWDKIISAYNNGLITQLTEDMNNGTTREVELDLDNDGTAETTGHLRIANLSTPSECETEGFSQTACGFVIEFSDIITTHRMNAYNNTTQNGVDNKGGWEYSDMRAYLNSTTYAYESIDYSTTGIYNKLPSDLKSAIINTPVVSGYGIDDTDNFTTTDKLYLLSTHEVYEDVDENVNSGIDYYDTAYSNTRQLDYYKSQGVTTSNYSGAIKQYNGSNYECYEWWLRSAYSTDSNFYSVDCISYLGIGNWSYTSSSTNNSGVSPAFRIAE